MYDNGLLTVVAIVFLVFGILQIILFFKVWGMTNRVKDILKVVSNDYGLNPQMDYGEVSAYCERQVELAKRMIAIEDDNAIKVLKGLIYDIDTLKKTGSVGSYGISALNKYVKIAEELLSAMNK